MSYTTEVSSACDCDGCGRILDDKEETYCARCYDNLQNEIKQLQSKISNLEDDVARLEDENMRLASNTKEM